jgi:alpha-tubulin suppressor-like RCC1 family protein
VDRESAPNPGEPPSSQVVPDAQLMPDAPDAQLAPEAAAMPLNPCPAGQAPGTDGSCLSVRSVVAGRDHFCTLTADGAIWCWGGESECDLGLGLAAHSGRPVRLHGSEGAVSIALGCSFLCALHADSTVWCYGRGRGNPHGDSEAQSSFTRANDLTGVVEIAAGWGHACARMPDGAVQCWGENYSGELGDGTTTPRPTPATVSKIGPSASIFARDENSCSVSTDGELWCWGSNMGGLLGLPEIEKQSSSPVRINSVASVIDVDLASMIACGLQQDGMLGCWGYHPPPVPGGYEDGGWIGPEAGADAGPATGPCQMVNIEGAQEFGLSVSDGFALLKNGTAVTWGTQGACYASVEYPVGAYPALQEIPSMFHLSVGDYHGMALDSGGRAWWWGFSYAALDYDHHPPTMVTFDKLPACANSNNCLSCCHDTLPQQALRFGEYFQDSVCPVSYKCMTECSQVPCVDPSQQPSNWCIACLWEMIGQGLCDDPRAQCLADPLCAPYLDCVKTCPEGY